MKPFLGLLGVLAAMTGCGSLGKKELKQENLEKFFAAVSSANAILVYEGLPPRADAELYAREAKRRDLVWFEGYPFYSRPLELTSEEKKQLTRIALRPEDHLDLGPAEDESDGFHPSKYCLGEFHPDYAIVWKSAGKTMGPCSVSAAASGKASPRAVVSTRT